MEEEVRGCFNFCYSVLPISSAIRIVWGQLALDGKVSFCVKKRQRTDPLETTVIGSRRLSGLNTRPFRGHVDGFE